MAIVHIELYNNTERENKINKTLPTGTELTGYIRDSFNIFTPSIVIEKPTVTFNYCYIQELKRYYFVRSYNIINAKQIEIVLQEDVLKTYETEIAEITGTIIEMENSNKYFSGYDTSHDVRPITEKHDFENNFNTSGNIIMVVLRGDK